jgi:hypothetical protein
LTPISEATETSLKPEEAQLLGSQESAREGARLARQAARVRAGKRVNQARQAPNCGMPPPASPNQAFNPAALINIRRVINLAERSIRAVRYTHQIRAELELKTYGREVLVRDFVSRAGCRPI